MQKIEVKILDHNLNGMPLFLAKLTQRGHEISSAKDLMSLYFENINKIPSERFMRLPHTTLRRMSYLTVAIIGLSTKAVSQLRTHAKHLTFLSTSTQYSNFANREDNFVQVSDMQTDEYYKKLEDTYRDLLQKGYTNDEASYILPQSLRKTLIVSGSLADWEYVLQTRLCKRNSDEVRYVSNMIVNEINQQIDKAFTVNMKPNCQLEGCKEDYLSCKRR